MRRLYDFFKDIVSWVNILNQKSNSQTKLLACYFCAKTQNKFDTNLSLSLIYEIVKSTALKMKNENIWTSIF